MKAVYTLLLCCLFTACAKPELKNILRPSKMQAVMWDILRADELSDYNASMDTAMRSWTIRAAYYKEIFRLHEITEQDFKKSLKYYQDHPSSLQIILDSLQAQGERFQKKEANKPSYPVSSPQIKKDTARKL